MPLINADVKGLEVVGCAYLSRDPVLRTEILNNEDIHANNQKAFNLPSRLIAKIFKFRMIYGGNEFSYASDPDFQQVSRSTKFWLGVISDYYQKYSGIKVWHDELLRTVASSGRLEMVTGRVYTFTRGGHYGLPETKIKNYPVQGLGADLVAIARVSLRTALQRSGLEYRLVSSVHDSIVIDTPMENVYNICMLMKQAVETVPDNFHKLFGVSFDLPLQCEIKVGQNLKQMELYANPS